jgi:hypothetical protein
MSEIRAATVSNLAGTGPVTLTGQFAAKAWVNFNGTGTVAIRASGNVSSITDNGTGDYTVNFTTAMADANYAVVASSDWECGPANKSTANYSGSGTDQTASAVRLFQTNLSGSARDVPHASVGIFR